MNKISGLNIIAGALLLGLCVSVAGCSAEEDVWAQEEWNEAAGEHSDIRFMAYTGLSEGIDSRAEGMESRAPSSVAILSSRYGTTKFHIHVSGINRLGEKESRHKDYVVSPGKSGLLLSADDDGKKPLNWLSRKEKHEFWSWTTPWLPDEEHIESSDSDDIPDDEINSDSKEISPEELYAPMQIEFKNTSIVETDKDAKFTGGWRNGQNLELFVGASSKDLVYQDNGEFVELQYRHLVSKIFLASFTLVNNATLTSASNLKGNITFYGVPDKAIFYPTPYDANGDLIKDQDGNPLIDEYGNPLSRPIVKADKNAGNIVTFALTNNSSHPNNPSFTEENGGGILQPGSSISTITLYDCWYLCPEVDLSKVSYKIEIYEYVNNVGWIRNRTYGLNGAFYGDFKSVKFSRKSGNNYDIGDGSDDTVLHAGEYLILNFNLSTKGNASTSGTIVDWSKYTQNRQASTHSQSGLYTFQESKTLSDIMKEGDPDKINEYYEMFGSGHKTSENPDDPNFKDDLKILKLMDDIGYNGTGTSTSSSSAKMPEFYVADGYIVDGQGHTVNMSAQKVSIGQMRDVYLRYYTSKTTSGVTTYTEYIVYIDPEGKVWLIDPETYRETPTDYNVNSATSNPFSIDLATGQIT